MKIQILGPGCNNCKKLFEQAQKALAQAGISAEMEKIEQLDQIMQFGVPMTPALVIDGVVKSAGKIPDVSEIVTWLSQHTS